MDKTAIGMESVTAGFGEYDLKEIIKEYKESATSEELEYNLPETVGGSRVHLLLGIKNTTNSYKSSSIGSWRLPLPI